MDAIYERFGVEDLSEMELEELEDAKEEIRAEVAELQALMNALSVAIAGKRRARIRAANS